MLQKAQELANHTATLASTPHWGVDDQDTLEWLIGQAEIAEQISVKDKILAWFFNGRVGSSSKAMVGAFLDMPKDPSCIACDCDHPLDPADLNRCLLLLEAVPEIRQNMDKLAEMSSTWAKLVARWDELERCFLDEAGLDWSKERFAPRTFQLMQEIGC